jgi:hypothetical protein
MTSKYPTSCGARPEREFGRREKDAFRTIAPTVAYKESMKTWNRFMFQNSTQGISRDDSRIVSPDVRQHGAVMYYPGKVIHIGKITATRYIKRHLEVYSTTINNLETLARPTNAHHHGIITATFPLQMHQ